MTTAHEADPNWAGEVSRRQWARDVAIAGAVVATGAGLAACSTSASTSAGPAPSATRAGTGIGRPTPTAASGTTPSAGHRTAPADTRPAPPVTPDDLTPSFVVTKASSIPVGGGVIYPKHGVVVTQPTAGQYKCFNASCTHLGCTVNKVTAGMIVCPCHGAKFSIVDGSVKAGPALRPLTVEDFDIKDGEIVLD